jgi:hypothetical protein
LLWSPHCRVGVGWIRWNTASCVWGGNGVDDEGECWRRGGKKKVKGITPPSRTWGEGVLAARITVSRVWGDVDEGGSAARLARGIPLVLAFGAFRGPGSKMTFPFLGENRSRILAH